MIILIDYLAWHYNEALRAILTIQKNYVTGVWHHFFIGQHFKTLFSPWHRRQPSDFGKTSTISGKIVDGVIDFYIRILAAIVRLVIIVVGLFWLTATYVAFWVLFVFWLLWPLIFLSAMIRGLSLIL